MGAQIRSTLGIPLWKGDEILGVIQVDNRESGVLTSGDLEIMAVLAHNASLAVANARLVKRLRAAEERLKKENAFLKSKEQERRGGNRAGGGPEIIGQSAPMKALLQQLEKVVNTRVTVLIEGETGVGKELDRRERPLSLEPPRPPLRRPELRGDAGDAPREEPTDCFSVANYQH